MWRGLFLLLAGWLMTGCDSLRGPHQQYTAPAVTGRVVEAGTGQPIAGARVERLLGSQRTSDPTPRHGGSQMMNPPPTLTEEDGRFSIPAERGAYLVAEHSMFFAFTLLVQHPRHLTCRKDVDLLKTKPVQTGKGPLVDVGDIALPRSSD